MQLSALKGRVQPALLQDFDAVYEEYVLEVGHGRLRPFVEHLQRWSLIDAPLVSGLLADAPDAEPEPEAEMEVQAPRDSSPGATPAAPPVPAALSRTTLTPISVSRAAQPPAVTDTRLESALADEAATSAPDAEAAADPATGAPLDPDLDATLERGLSGIDPAADTVQLPTREAMEAMEEAIAAKQIAHKTTTERPTLPRPEVSSGQAETVELSVAALRDTLDRSEAPPPAEPSDEAEWEDVPEADDDSPKRTMFRKVTGGVLEEMGRFGETPDLPRARRRRRRVPIQSTDRYVFSGTVGEGAMGRVLLARDGILQRDVAYKVMSEDLLQQPALASKFGAEARITAQLDHPNVVPVYELESPTSYTMKLIEGRTLETILQEVRALVDANQPVPEAMDLDGRLEWFGRVCEAVAYAHSRGVIHRDLKPENIMVGQWGEVYVMDWGIAKVVSTDVEHPVEVPDEEEDEGELIIGTAGYMSPEQAEGWNDRLTGASDQYAMGLILFELVALIPAVTGKVAMKLVMRHQDGEKDPFVHRTRQAIPKELVAIVHKATAKDIDHRYASVADLGDDVRRFLRGDPVLARPDGPIGALLRWMGKHRELTAMVVLVAVLGSAILVTAMAGYGQVRVAQAQAQEQRITTLITDAAKQTSLIDGQFLKIEGLLSVVSTAAAEALQRSVDNPEPLYTAADFQNVDAAPPDAEPPSRGDKYGTGMVSTTTPVVLPSGPLEVSTEEGDGESEPSPLRLRLDRLSGLGRHFQRVLLRSHSERRAATNRSLARRTIMEVDIPVSWTFVALADGSLLSFPGHGGWPEDFQARKTQWYGDAAEEQAPVWGRVDVHPVTKAPILTVSQAVLDVTDATSGVAGVHLSMPRLLGLLVPPAFAHREGVRAFILDEKGRVVVDSEYDPSDSSLDGLGDPFPIATVREAAVAHQTGLERHGGQLYVYNRMTSNGWTYVLHGPEASLLR